MLSFDGLVWVEWCLLMTYQVVSLAQVQFRQRVAVYQDHAGRTRQSAEHCRRKAASNASLALTATGDRAQRYHRNREAQFAREAARLEATATWYADRARVFDCLQR